MKKSFNIGIATAGFIEWPGGIEFLKYILSGLKHENYQITLLVPDRNTVNLKFVNLIKKVLNSSFKKKYTILNFPDVKETCDYLKVYLNVGLAVTYRRKNEFVKLANKLDLILPSFYPPSEKLAVPVISYLYDFQYKYFADFFSEKQITKQDEHFKKHIDHSKEIIINAYAVKKDIEKFYGRTESLHVIPFTPIFDSDTFLQIPDFKTLNEKYKLGDKPYFLISNQFWRHKGHKTAFEAFVIASKKHDLDFNIICTGRFPDPKNAEYCRELQNIITDSGLIDKIKFVGFIDKIDQLGLMLNSRALVQPTQFEGGPGGFSVYEALGHMHRCLISDIDVNKELLNEEFVSFFKVNDADDLAKGMKYHLGLPTTNINTVKLQTRSELRKKLLNEFWTKLINEILVKNG